jgi:cytochrome c oxidase subunit II
MTNWFMSYMPLQASQHAAEIDHMTVLVHWLMLIMFIGWGAFFMFVLVRFRKGANPTASYAGAKGKFAKGTEIVVAIIEIVLLVGYAIPAWATRVRPMPANNEAVIVRVVGEQFAWNVHYPGPDGKFGRTDVHLVAADNPLGLDKNDADAKDDLTEINQLNVPVDRPVLVHLSSKDVIHSFGLYEMRIKQDAVPGLDIPLWFIPTVTTEEMRRKVGKPDFEYEIACSQLCGLGHYRMRGFVTVQSAADFKKWFDDQQREQHPPAAAPAAANPAP